MPVLAIAAAFAWFGVNYYPPFSVDYDEIARSGLDHRAVMRDDVQHFRRLGLDGIRLHCFDRQISDSEGNLVVNEHVRLLDWLIAHCEANGIKTVLTPIAWWGGKFAQDKGGFSNFYTMEQMTSDVEALKAQTRFLKAFGRRYGRSPGVVAFELVNEPLYKEGLPDSGVTAYVNALADALRSGGTDKPVFYNSWKGRNSAAGASCIDGISGSCYPTGLNAPHEWTGDLLSKVKATTLDPKTAPVGMRRMIYEFDAPCASCSYLYPAMARLFRQDGAESAFQFQYDPLPLASDNRNWKNHYLNLVYTPSKALSLAIAAEVFRRERTGCEFTRSRGEMVFPPFRVDARRDLAQLTTETDFIYTNDPIDEPSDASRLRRIWGVGSSRLVSCDGRGAYFLDKASDGVWRLQLYPDVFRVVESCATNAETVALSRAFRVAVRLPDVGPSWRAVRVPDMKVVAQASDFAATLPPGDYVLDGGTSSREALSGAATMGTVPVFVVPVLSDESRNSLERRAGQALPMPNMPNARRRLLPLFDVGDCMNAKLEGAKWCVRTSSTDDFGISALCIYVSPDDAGKCGYVGVKVPFDNERLCSVNPVARGAEIVCVRAKGSFDGEKLEVVFTQSDETAWGATIALSPKWERHFVRVSDLQPKWDTVNMPWRGTSADPGLFTMVNVGFGKWLFSADSIGRAHSFEVSSIALLDKSDKEAR